VALRLILPRLSRAQEAHFAEGRLEDEAVERGELAREVEQETDGLERRPLNARAAGARRGGSAAPFRISCRVVRISSRISLTSARRQAEADKTRTRTRLHSIYAHDPHWIVLRGSPLKRSQFVGQVPVFVVLAMLAKSTAQVR
jgi:hypothetical protein